MPTNPQPDLAALYAAASPRPWLQIDEPEFSGIFADGAIASGNRCGHVADFPRHADAALVVALVNGAANPQPPDAERDLRLSFVDLAVQGVTYWRETAEAMERQRDEAYRESATLRAENARLKAEPPATEREGHIRGKFARWGLHASVCAEDVRDLLALLDAGRAEIARLRAEPPDAERESLRALALDALHEAYLDAPGAPTPAKDLLLVRCDAAEAEIKRLKAELGNAKAVNSSLMWDGGRPPVNALDPIGGD